MGKITANSREDADEVATFTGVAATGRCGAKDAAGTPFHAGGPFNLTVIGSSFVGTWRLVRSFDGGATWVACTSLGSAITFAGDASEAVPAAFEASVLYDVEITAYTSGSLSGRLSR